MGVLKEARTLRYLALVLLLTHVSVLLACRKNQSLSAQEAAQNGLVQSVAPSQAWPKTAAGKIPVRILYVGLFGQTDV